jgi:hypothetical protein
VVTQLHERRAHASSQATEDAKAHASPCAPTQPPQRPVPVIRSPPVPFGLMVTGSSDPTASETVAFALATRRQPCT